jgi:hypothetical protein
MHKLPEQLDGLKIKVAGECWLWGDYLHHDRPTIVIDRKPKSAANEVWRRVKGHRVPKGMGLKPTCDNKRCVNPAHRVMVERRMMALKILPKEAREIAKRVSRGEVSRAGAARDLGVDPRTVGTAVRRFLPPLTERPPR